MRFWPAKSSIRLQNRQSIADEHHRRFHRSIKLASRADRRVLPDDERLFFAIACECQTGLLRDEHAAVQFERLPVAVRARRFQTDRLELGLDILDGLVEPRRADVAALELVVSQKLDMRPPRLAFGREIGRLRARNGGGRGRRTPMEKTFSFTGYLTTVNATDAITVSTSASGVPACR